MREEKPNSMITPFGSSIRTSNMPFERYFRDDSHPDDPCESSSTSLFHLPHFMQNDPLVFNPQSSLEFLPVTSTSGNTSWATNPGSFHVQDTTYHHPSASYSSFSSLSNALHLPGPSKPTTVVANNPVSESVLGKSHPYSSTGFDILPLLARVVNRPNPCVAIGHVDLSCSFVVADVRLYDSPIVYCSPSFCHLTGYEEHEIIGRNCRFLQSPVGFLQPGEPRKHTDLEAIARLRRCQIANKECQTRFTNYRKGGAPFLNFLTVIPLPGGVNGLPYEADDYVYHIGFQVDLGEHPQTAIVRQPGGNLVNYTSSSISPAMPPASRDRKFRVASVSSVLRTIFMDPLFIQSIPLSHASTSVVPSMTSFSERDGDEAQHILNMLLLERSPDFIHVVSLKGHFLYVAPSVRGVLGYEPEELMGKSISEICHPADLVPLMRELKESSVGTQNTHESQHSPTSPSIGTGSMAAPKTVDILFRAQSKYDGFLWVECRGRLHVEPGKGRKAIILSGRARQMPRLSWASVARAGGLISPSYANRRISTQEMGNRDPSTTWEVQPVQQEFWGMMTCGGTFLSVEAAVQDILGWGAEELVGTGVEALCALPSNDRLYTLRAALAKVCQQNHGEHVSAQLLLKSKGGCSVPVVLVLFASVDRGPSDVASGLPVVFQIRLAHLSYDTRIGPLIHPSDSNVFEELEISRGTSWQYELQQLKFANQRLLQEIRELEEEQLVGYSYSGTKRSWDGVEGPRVI